MKIKFIKTLIIVNLILLSSCTKKIDGSSDEKIRVSIENIKNSLSNDKKKEFEDSLKIIMFQDLDFASLMQKDGAEKMTDSIKTKLNGKTADDVIIEAKKIKEELELKKKEQARIEIDELYIKKADAEYNAKKLKDFKIISSQFYKYRESEYIPFEQPIIKLTLRNNTKHSISRAYFKGTLSSKGRTIPWLSEEFNHKISGGLEPNETDTWHLNPNMFSAWGTVEAPKDAILTVEVTKLDGENGQTLYSVIDFGEYEKERLNELLNDYPEFKR